ncbi:MAG: restriction endonuclease subunit S, partial [Prevotella sp.]|nr:restriction endonuclease subunit S [Prevotella sp.]
MEHSLMKDSGVDWIGKIPENWNLAGIKRLFTLCAGATPDSNSPANWDGDIIWVTPADFKTQDKFVNQGKRNISQLGYDSCSATIVDKGSIIFSKRAPIGTVSICEVPLCTNQGCISCIPHSDANSLFYYYYLSVFTEQFELYGSGTTFKEISMDNFANFKVTIPPTLEQSKIATFLDFKTSEINSLIDNLNKQIESLKEYKKSLIYK